MAQRGHLPRVLGRAHLSVLLGVGTGDPTRADRVAAEDEGFRPSGRLGHERVLGEANGVGDNERRRVDGGGLLDGLPAALPANGLRSAAEPRAARRSRAPATVVSPARYPLTGLEARLVLVY
jgi:hypothetical protein